jgi:hypothetical protein
MQSGLVAPAEGDVREWCDSDRCWRSVSGLRVSGRHYVNDELGECHSVTRKR